LPGLWLYRFRAHLIEIIARIFPAPESGLITGIILGPRNNISDDLYNAFRNSGTSHIIAISGFNIAILAALISAICLRAFGHWKGAITALIAIALYAMLVGGGASVVRASIMGGLAIMAQQIGRKQAGLNTLALTAFVMLLFNPMLLWDVGFQLSFFATLGLVWFASPFQEAFKNFAARYIPEEHLQRVADWTGEYCSPSRRRSPHCRCCCITSPRCRLPCWSPTHWSCLLNRRLWVFLPQP
jgi:competence protein ComEC